VTITFEVGVQNLALSFAINFNMLMRPDLAVAGLLYAAIMPATALAFVSIGRRLIIREQRTVAAADVGIVSR
jgi:predicted Na+-dependent transporter